MRCLWAMFFLLCTIASCRKETNPSNNVAPINSFKIDEALNSPEEAVKLSTICDTLYYVCLETKDESLINRISSIKCDSDLIFILDKGERILAFNNEGKFIRQIGAKGKGPGEYASPVYLEIDKVKKHLIVYDDPGRKVCIYDYNSELVNTIDLREKYYHYYIPFRDTSLLAYAEKPFPFFNDGFNIGIFNKEGILSESILKRDEKGSIDDITAVAYNQLYYFKDTISLWEFHYDTIYRILPSLKLVPSFSFNMGEYKMPMKFRNSKSFRQELKYPHISNVIESEEQLFLSVTTLRGSKKILIEKKNGTIRNLGNSGFLNNINNLTFFWPSYLIDSNKLVSVIQPIDLLKDMKEKKRNVTLSDSEHKLLENLELLDNPWIVFLTIK